MSFTLARSRLDGAFPWLSVPTIALLAGGAVMLGVLLVLARRAPDPIINLRALTNRAYGSAILLGCLVSVALANVQVYAWFFNRHGAIGSIGGSYPLPNPEQVAAALTFAAGAVVAGQVMWRTGRCKWPTRALLLIGMVGALLLARLTSQTTMVDLALAMAVMGLGLGGMSAVLITVVQNAMPYRSLGEVTAGLSFFGALAVALTGPFFHWLAQTSYAEVLTRPPPEGRAGVDVFAAPLDALSWVFLVTAALMAVGFVIALWLPETPVGRTTVPSSPRPTGLGRLRGPRRHAATSLPPPSVPTIPERRAREAPPRPPTDPAGDDARRTPPSTGGPVAARHCAPTDEPGARSESSPGGTRKHPGYQNPETADYAARLWRSADRRLGIRRPPALPPRPPLCRPPAPAQGDFRQQHRHEKPGGQNHNHHPDLTAPQVGNERERPLDPAGQRPPGRAPDPRAPIRRRACGALTNRLRGDMPPELSRISHLSDLTLGGSNQFASCIPQGLHENAFSHVLLSDLDQLGLPFCGAAGSAST